MSLHSARARKSTYIRQGRLLRRGKVVTYLEGQKAASVSSILPDPSLHGSPLHDKELEELDDQSAAASYSENLIQWMSWSIKASVQRLR